MTIYECILGVLVFVVLIVEMVKMKSSNKKLPKPYTVSFRNTYKGTKVPLIRLKVRGKYYYFLIDTGANTSIIDTKFYESLPPEIKGLSVQQDVHITGIGDKVEVKDGQEKVIRQTKQSESITLDMQFGPYKYEDTIFVIADLRAPFTYLERILHEPVIGLLGTDFIKKYKWNINFVDMSIHMPN